MTRAHSALAAALAIPLLAMAGEAIEIRHVSHAPTLFNPANDESVRIRFHLREAGEVTLNVYDARQRLVRSMHAGSALAAGDQTLEWDGKDDRGRRVPPEAYSYTLEASGGDGATARWDATDFAGQAVHASEVAWRPEEGHLVYHLPEHSRVRIRIGLANGGPLLHTLLNWVPRTRGTHREAWDGRDAAGVVDLASHPALEIDLAAFRLPQNAILVGPPPSEPAYLLLPDDTPLRVRRAEPVRHRMFDYGQHAAEDLGDYEAILRLPAHLPRTAEGVAIASEAIAIEATVPEEGLRRLVDQRSEAVFYVDGQYVFERETGFLPLTWTWDPTGHAPGLHYITVNLRGYEGHFGIATTAVCVPSPSEACP